MIQVKVCDRRRADAVAAVGALAPLFEQPGRDSGAVVQSMEEAAASLWRAAGLHRGGTA